ncbi:hypothetical protein LY28_00475 [Ruminiclostridium sufflavum DSM 19573]|uniref:Uncharacterized protein n=1 Tax=Ruminiclostridium sufflavum DSM 19573 TaxID=1121337 RepID=A0A318XR35_9FIRM|nr:hypothetical protein [Ruminiclostridium sufflavum]PYG89876.1 hypothetical protein LY28_00475 [Ruminiclostridium sufflavum DSM 19573]
MSMPNIPNLTPIIDIDREDAFNMLLASIAMEEMGLAHIINAEGEKLQYLFKSEAHKPFSIADIKDVNYGVEKVIRETMKLQMLLQEKLDTVITHIPNVCSTPYSPCPPPKPKCIPECILTGYGEGYISDEANAFKCGTATIESSLCNLYENCTTFSIKYTLFKETEGSIRSAILLSLPQSIEVHCNGNAKSCQPVQDANTIVVQGQGVMAIKNSEQRLTQCAVSFTLTVWDYGCNKKFQMIICSLNSEFNNDSGIVTLTAGNLEIENCAKTNRSPENLSAY